MMKTELILRLGFFLGVLFVMALWEYFAPRRRLTVNKGRRWTNNLGIVLIDVLILRLTIPAAAMGMAVFAWQNGWGIFNTYHFPGVLAVSVSVLLLDGVIYLQHVMFHTVPLFWRLHMVHHADLDIDVTTGLRFHPIEIFLSMGIKVAAVAVIGPPVVAVLIFEIVLNATAMFNHGNVRIPEKLDRILRLFLVTPDMHRVHHSVTIRETNSNFGFSFPWWDRIFGTYRAQPVAGHDGMTIGLAQFRDVSRLDLPRLLLLPFTGSPGAYAINKRGKTPEKQP